MADFTPVVTARGLTKSFVGADGERIDALSDLTLSMPPNVIVSLVGVDGAGKTTFMRHITGLMKADSGELSVLGINPATDSQAVQDRISYMPQAFGLYEDLSVSENLDLYADLHGVPESKRKERYPELLAMADLARYLDRPAGKLSGGMKQRVVIAIALACNPKVLIADEPTTALDVTIQAQVLEMMRCLKDKYHTATLLITHDLGVVAQMCEKVAIIYAGEVVESGAVLDIYKHTLHPYTEGLLGAIPQVHLHVHRLSPIDGLMPDPMAQRTGCPFADRCKYAFERCRVEHPRFIDARERPQGWRCFQR